MRVRNGFLFVPAFESGNRSELSSCVGAPVPGDPQCTFDFTAANFAQNPQLVGFDVDIAKDPTMPDRDLFVFDTTTDAQVDVVERHRHAALRPDGGLDRQGLHRADRRAQRRQRPRRDRDAEAGPRRPRQPHVPEPDRRGGLLRAGAATRPPLRARAAAARAARCRAAARHALRHRDQRRRPGAGRARRPRRTASFAVEREHGRGARHGSTSATARAASRCAPIPEPVRRSRPTC